MSAVKGDWALELAHYKDHPEAIKHALSLLPAERPPTVLQFRELCRSAPGPVFQALPGPKPDAGKAAEVRAMVAESLRAGRQHPKAWAMRLIERADRGEPVPLLNLRMAREALGLIDPRTTEQAPVRLVA